MVDSAAERAAIAHLYKSIETPLSVEQFVKKWSVASKFHFNRHLTGEISFHGQRRDRVREMIDSSLSNEDANRIFAAYYAKNEAGWALFPDAMPCLKSLSGFRLGLITNGQGELQHQKLCALALSKCSNVLLFLKNSVFSSLIQKYFFTHVRPQTKYLITQLCWRSL